MFQMKGRGMGVETMLILTQHFAVKDLEILGNIYEKGVVYTTVGDVLVKHRKEGGS
jgi:chaperonin cofactor prefoldin